MFVKRVGRFMQVLLSQLNDADFKPLSDIDDPIVSEEDTVNVKNTVKTLEAMQHIEVVTDENGSQSLRLTPSGAVLLSAFNQKGR